MYSKQTFQSLYFLRLFCACLFVFPSKLFDSMALKSSVFKLETIVSLLLSVFRIKSHFGKWPCVLFCFSRKETMEGQIFFLFKKTVNDSGFTIKVRLLRG